MRGIIRGLPGIALVVVIGAGSLALSHSDAFAQYGRTFRSSVKLTDTDLVIIRKIVREDFAEKPFGTTQQWSNPESENSGTVTLLDRFASQGRDCRRVKYFVRPGAKQPSSVVPSQYVMTTCRLPDGSWKLDNAAQRDASR